MDVRGRRGWDDPEQKNTLSMIWYESSSRVQSPQKQQCILMHVLTSRSELKEFKVSWRASNPMLVCSGKYESHLALSSHYANPRTAHCPWRSWYSLSQW